MRIIVCPDAERASDLVADEILRALRGKPSLTLGLPAGSSPVGVYARLSQAFRVGQADFSQACTVNLDELVGLAAEHPRSFRAFMARQLFEHVNIPPERQVFPPTEGPGLALRCERLEHEIAVRGGIDLMLLGLGPNGHIAFNEPLSSFASRTRVAALAPPTLAAVARGLADHEPVPIAATTLGIGTILEARRLLLIAFGSSKAAAVQSCLQRPPTVRWPGSALQLHPDVTVYLDPPAAARLPSSTLEALGAEQSPVGSRQGGEHGAVQRSLPQSWDDHPGQDEAAP